MTSGSYSSSDAGSSESDRTVIGASLLAWELAVAVPARGVLFEWALLVVVVLAEDESGALRSPFAPWTCATPPKPRLRPGPDPLSVCPAPQLVVVVLPLAVDDVSKDPDADAFSFPFPFPVVVLLETPDRPESVFPVPEKAGALVLFGS